MKISFGQKIPTALCKIMDTKENKMITALVSELDCYDKEDIQLIKKLGPEWNFSETISLNMERKYTSNKRGEGNDSKFYTIENDTGEILGISYVDDKEKSFEVKFIESRNDHRYKYIGQTLLATMAKQVINSRQQKMIIKSAIADAYDFYEKVCGFKPAEYSDLEMNRYDLIRFIRRTEDKTENTIKLMA